MLPEVQKLKFLHEQIGISNVTLGRYCNCSNATIGRYIKGEIVPVENARRNILVGLQQLVKDLNEGMEV